MSAGLADLFVTFGAKDGGLGAALNSVHQKLDTLKGKLDAITGKATVAFAIGAAAITGFVHAALEGDDATQKLRIALQANGEEVEQNLEAFSALADHLKEITTYDDDAIKGAMALALNMGVAGSEIESVTKGAVGLAAIMGGDLEAGMRASAAAAAGNYKAVKSMIPELAALSDEAARARVGELMGRGFIEAQLAAQTLGGQLKQLGNALGDVVKGIGNELLPIVRVVVGFVRKLADWFNGLSGTMKKVIAITLVVVTALAGLIAALPLIISFISSLITVIGAVLSPIGLIVAGIAALAAGLIYAAGTGDSFTERMTSGFFKVLAVVTNVVGGILRMFAFMNDMLLKGVHAVVDSIISAWGFVASAIDAAFGSDIGKYFDAADRKADEFFKGIKERNDKLDGLGKSLWGVEGEDLRKKVNAWLDKLKGEVKGTEDAGDLSVGKKIGGGKDSKSKESKIKPTSAVDFLRANVTSRALSIASQSAALKGVIDKKRDELEAAKATGKNTAKAVKELERLNDQLRKLQTGYR